MPLSESKLSVFSQSQISLSQQSDLIIPKLNHFQLYTQLVSKLSNIWSTGRCPNMNHGRFCVVGRRFSMWTRWLFQRKPPPALLISCWEVRFMGALLKLAVWQWLTGSRVTLENIYHRERERVNCRTAIIKVKGIALNAKNNIVALRHDSVRERKKKVGEPRRCLRERRHQGPVEQISTYI